MAPPYGAHSTAEEVTEGLNLRGQTWLITGINSGLGEETARVLALRGASLIGAARTEQKAKDALNKLGVDGRAVACELSDIEGVRAAVEQLREGAPLAGIIANAGIMALPELQQVNGIERQFATNHVGHFALITGLLDHLTDRARVVLLSSGAHYMAKQGLELDNLSGERDYDPWRMYGRSKLANLLFAKSLAERFQGTKRTANAVHPGVIRTQLARHIQDIDALYAPLSDHMKSVEQGAATQCYVAVHPATKALSGQYFSDCKMASMSKAAKDPRLPELLWARTEELLGR